MRRFAALFAVALLLPVSAAAQDLPSYAIRSTPAVETIHGRITDVKSPYAFTLLDDRGYYDNVVLREGTVINPTGLTLAAGMTVTIVGSNAGDAFAADEVDSSLVYNGPSPQPAYYGPGWWYPGFPYGFGPAFGLGFIGGATLVLVQRPFFHRHPFHPFHPFARRFPAAQPFGTASGVTTLRATMPAGAAPVHNSTAPNATVHGSTGTGRTGGHAMHGGRR